MIANLGHKRSYVGMKPTPATIAFGNRLTRAIDDRGLSQNELSRRTGLAQGVISGYTKGTRRAYFDQAASLASAIGVSLDSLCGLQREEPAITPEEQTLLDVIRRSGRSPVEVLAILAARQDSGALREAEEGVLPTRTEPRPGGPRDGQAGQTG